MLPSTSEPVCRHFILLLCARTGWHVVYAEFVNFIGGADGWPAHEGRQHVYSGKLLCLQGVVEGGMFGGGVQKDGGIRINI